MVATAAVNELVGQVLTGLPEGIRQKCDRAKILSALDGLGCSSTMDDLREHMLAAPDDIKSVVVGGPAPAFFFVRFQKAVTGPSEDAGGAASLGRQFADPTASATAASGVGAKATAADVPLVVTINFNGRVLAERTTLSISPDATWEAVARLRLTAALGEQSALEYMSTPLTVSLFRSADHRPTDRVAAAISDTVANGYLLGYPFAVLSFTAKIYGCAKPSTAGKDPFLSDKPNPFKNAQRAPASDLPNPYKPKEEGGTLNFELALYNAVREQCEREQLRVNASDVARCHELFLQVRNAVWQMCGREGEFKWAQVPARFKEYFKPRHEGGFDVKLAKAKQGSLSQSKVLSAATGLRSAVDVPSFMRSERWEHFRDDANQLHAVLQEKLSAMKADAASAATRREANATKSAELKPRLVPPTLTGTAPKYATLEAVLWHMSDYSVLALPEEKCLELHPLSDEAVGGKDPDAARRKHVERWRNGMGFESFAVEVLEATWGGQRKLSLFVWRVPIDATARETAAGLAGQAAAIANVERQLPVICGRYARQQFVQQYSNVTGLSKGMLTNMYGLLTSDGQAVHSSAAAEMQKRCVEFVANCGDVELFPDLRALNGNDGSKYDLFWAEGDRFLAELETTANENRHGQERALRQPLSVPDFTRQVESRLCQAGHSEAPIPNPHWVAFQFHPRRPTTGIAQRYTGRWAIKLQVLQKTLRKNHIDGHWCNALELNVKGFIRELDTRLQADYAALHELRTTMEELLEEMSRLPCKVDAAGNVDSTATDDKTDHSPSEYKAEQLALKVGELAARAYKDRAISAKDLKGWLAGESSMRVARLSDDTKCKVPVGEPGARVSSNVRPSGPAPAHLSVALAALDHGWHRASITPSVTLRTTMPDLSDRNQSWRRGPLTVRLYDSTFQSASAFRNSAEMLQTINLTCSFGAGRGATPLHHQASAGAATAKVVCIIKRTDGGPEQNMKNGSVQLADIALMRTSGADLLVHTRPAPDESWVNDVEGCMAVFNLGLQHVALERALMDPLHEELFKNAGSMKAAREVVNSIENPAKRKAALEAWAKSISVPVGLLQERFSRLVYSDCNVCVLPPASLADIKKQHAAIKAIDASWEPHMTTQAALAKCPLLQEFMKSHVLQWHKYIFVPGKCNSPSCKFGCKPLRMPQATWSWLTARPRIVPFPMHRASSGREHFAPYEELTCVPTTEAHLPSFEAPKEPSKEAKAADKAKPINFGTSNYARSTIKCADCGKPRLLFAERGLSPNETALLEARLDDVIYTCGASALFDVGHVLEKKVHIKEALVCGMPVEKAYYSVGRFEPCCTWCGELDAARLVQLDQLDLGGKKGYPICIDCHGRGLDVVTHGKAVRTGAAAKKKVGKKRAEQHKGNKAAAAKKAKRAAVVSSEEEFEEDSEDESEDEVEGDSEGEEGGAEAEAAQGGSAAGQMEEDVWTVKRILAKEERSAGTYYLIDWEGWDLSEASWEPIKNILTAAAELRAFEETMAATPLREAFAEASPSGCCFGKLCQFGAPGAVAPSLEKCGSCGAAMHRLCAAENAWLKWIGPDSFEGLKCFDCSLVEALLKVTALPAQLSVYYKQLTDWSRVGPGDVTPFTVGAALATNALSLQQVCKSTQRKRLPPAVGKCKTCKKGGFLVACSFCTASFHNTEACLGDAKLESLALATSPTFPWACPTCFKKGVTAIQRAVLKPTGQSAAGAKRKRHK